MSIRLSNGRYEQIKREVIQLFTQCSIHCTPISGFEIAVNYGIKVVPYSALKEKMRNRTIQFSPDGFSAFDAGEWRICFNDNSIIPMDV